METHDDDHVLRGGVRRRVHVRPVPHARGAAMTTKGDLAEAVRTLVCATPKNGKPAPKGAPEPNQKETKMAKTKKTKAGKLPVPPPSAAQQAASADPGDIPGFLKRPPPTKEDAEALLKKARAQVSRPIKNPPNGKGGAERAAAIKSKGPSIGDTARAAILAGKTNEEALAAVMEAHKGCASNL